MKKQPPSYKNFLRVVSLTISLIVGYIPVEIPGKMVFSLFLKNGTLFLEGAASYPWDTYG